MKLEVVEWFAAVGIGGDRCVDREVRDWVDEAPIVVELKRDLHDGLITSLMEQFEQGSGLSANTEAVEVGREYWLPLVAPVVDAEWAALREPSVAWFAERLGCRTAWRLERGGVELGVPMVANYRRFWSTSTRVDALHEAVGALFDAHGDEFGALVLTVLPGPPSHRVPWDR